MRWTGRTVGFDTSIYAREATDSLRQHRALGWLVLRSSSPHVRVRKDGGRRTELADMEVHPVSHFLLVSQEEVVDNCRRGVGSIVLPYENLAIRSSGRWRINK